MSGEYPIPAGAVERAAEVLRAEYDSEFDASHLAWQDFAGSALTVLEAAAPLIVAAELSRLADELTDRANARHAVGGDDGPECDEECESSDCHTVSAVAAYSMTAGRLRARASVLRGEGDRE